MKSFQILSLLLSYPSAELQSEAGALRALLAAEGLVPAAAQKALLPLWESLAQGDLYDLQEAYVFLFDRTRSLSLNLFEHIHGESRDRGAAMVDLLAAYRAGGYDLSGSDLPDHLPLFLEFLATQDRAQALTLLADAAPLLALLAARLRARGTPYAAVFDALLALLPKALPKALAEVPEDEAQEDPNDLAALDATYAEAQVVFGPDPGAGCPVSRDILAQMAPPRPAMEKRL